MATNTIGSTGQTTLTGMVVSGAMADADIASLIALLKGDAGNPNSPIGSGYLSPGAWSHNGLLYIPGRGVLVTQPGDIVAVGPASGWPILVSKAAAATVDWVHT